MNKSILMEHFNEINSVGVNKEEALKLAIKAEKERDFSAEINNVTVGLSSGTSGNRGIFLVSTKEKARWVVYMLIRVIGFKWKHRKVAFFLRANSNLYEASKSSLITFQFFDLKVHIKQLLEDLEKYQPDILVAQSSVLSKIEHAQRKGSIHIKPQKIIAVAEVLDDQVKQNLTNTFKQIIHQVYQCTEGFLAYSCKEGHLHFNEDFVHIEKKWLDKQKERYHPIITDFSRKAMPIVRYELNDILHYNSNTCKCGSPFEMIDRIEGRSDDAFDLNGTIVFPDFVRRAVILTDIEIKEYQIIQTGPLSIDIKLLPRQIHLFKHVQESLEDLFVDLNINQKIDFHIHELTRHTFEHKLRRVYKETF